MEDKAYNISREGKYVFEFISTGKKLLLKRAVLTEMDDNPGVYNLALGTVLEDGIVNFMDSSNNGDVVRIFSTVIECIKIFTGDFPDKVVFFKGNTEQKNRVYNELLRRHYDDFSINFNIFGMSGRDGYTTVQKFNSNKNYTGFYLRAKF